MIKRNKRTTAKRKKCPGEKKKNNALETSYLQPWKSLVIWDALKQ